ncbi:MAG: hypothetical protein KAH57_08920 [Thermoplasmata archaeon]|nr:hypothetical protein [Thermoplasmata archaeon]
MKEIILPDRKFYQHGVSHSKKRQCITFGISLLLLALGVVSSTLISGLGATSRSYDYAFLWPSSNYQPGENITLTIEFNCEHFEEDVLINISDFEGMMVASLDPMAGSITNSEKWHYYYKWNQTDLKGDLVGMGRYHLDVITSYPLNLCCTGFNIFDGNITDIFTVKINKEIYEVGEDITFNVTHKWNVSICAMMDYNVFDQWNKPYYSFGSIGAFTDFASGYQLRLITKEISPDTGELQYILPPGTYVLRFNYSGYWPGLIYGHYYCNVTFRVNGTSISNGSEEGNDPLEEDDGNSTDNSTQSDQDNNETLDEVPDTNENNTTIDENSSTINDESSTNDTVNLNRTRDGQPSSEGLDQQDEGTNSSIEQNSLIGIDPVRIEDENNSYSLEPSPSEPVEIEDEIDRSTLDNGWANMPQEYGNDGPLFLSSLFMFSSTLILFTLVGIILFSSKSRIVKFSK